MLVKDWYAERRFVIDHCPGCGKRGMVCAWVKERWVDRNVQCWSCGKKFYMEASLNDGQTHQVAGGRNC